MTHEELRRVAERVGLALKPHWAGTAKCAVAGCDSPKGKTRFFCLPWVERHILGTL